jgi:hypothetical protein
VADYNGFTEAGLEKLSFLVSWIATSKFETGEVVDVDCRS